MTKSVVNQIEGLIDSKITPRFNHMDEELKRVNTTLAGLGGDIAELRAAITDLTYALNALQGRVLGAR